jgi:hypothetical protein
MRELQANNKLIGLLAITLGIVCLAAFLAVDNRKLIIPDSKLFFVKYFLIICIINGSLYFVIAGILIFTGYLVPTNSKTKIEYKVNRSKGILFSVIISSPFWISLFTTIYSMSKSIFWKISGGVACFYIIWLLYSNIKALITLRKV